ncbi:MAG: hypothetical protein WCK89_18030 [bacterium]
MKRLILLCAIQVMALVQTGAFAAATNSLPESRILLFDNYALTNNAPTPTWVHEGSASTALALKPLLAGTNHYHRTGWRLLFCRTGSTRVATGFIKVPLNVDTNYAAYLQNTLSARIESPVFTNGIGTVYFEAVNNETNTPTQISVDWSTNLTDWVTLTNITLSATSTNGFKRYVKSLNVQQPAKLRIRRTGTIYSAQSLDTALTCIDNIRVSPPPADVLVYNANVLNQSSYYILRCFVSNADTNVPAVSRVVTGYYRWPNLAPPSNAWAHVTLPCVDPGDGQGNGEQYETTLPTQVLSGTNEHYFVCTFDGYRYQSPDYTGLGYAGYPSETRSPFTTPVQTNFFIGIDIFSLIMIGNVTGESFQTPYRYCVE